ncbi:MAG TPA: hypothetical protein PK446_05740, partial [Methanomassiliicoccaceae archaeon]|nr:hypothetical protein [Methanomassiliicoccaceae archaeon]
MHKISDISMEADILAENRKLGDEIRHRLRSHNIRSVDVMGSIGAGKTLLIEKMAVELRRKGIRAAVLAGVLHWGESYLAH